MYFSVKADFTRDLQTKVEFKQASKLSLFTFHFFTVLLFLNFQMTFVVFIVTHVKFMTSSRMIFDMAKIFL